MCIMALNGCGVSINESACTSKQHKLVTLDVGMEKQQKQLK